MVTVLDYIGLENSLRLQKFKVKENIWNLYGREQHSILGTFNLSHVLTRKFGFMITEKPNFCLSEHFKNMEYHYYMLSLK